MIIDGHLHIAGTPDVVLRRMDALGIQRTVLIGVGVRDLGVVTVSDSMVFRIPFLLRTFGVWKSRAIVRSRRLRETLLPQPDNSKVAAAIRSHPDRFWGFVFVNPGRPESLTEAETRLASGFRGIKMALLQYPASLNGPRVSALCELARARNVPVFLHQGLTPETADPTAMIRRFPSVSFILAHAGVQYFEQAIDLARNNRNVWLDTSSYFVTPAKLERLRRDVGTGKLVFGSDVPVMARDPAEAMNKILGMHISDRERGAIMGGNLLEILNGTP